MSVTVNIPARTLAAAIKLAPKQDVRYYLVGTLLDLPKGRIVSTDGHAMFVAQIDNTDSEAVIVPRDLIESALKSLTKSARESDSPVKVTIAPSTDETGLFQSITLAVGSGAQFTGKAIDHKYPEYERVIPAGVSKPSGEVGQFNPSIVMDCASALQIATGDRMPTYVLQHNGLSAALMVASSRNAFCVVMPWRAGDAPDIEWFSNPESVELAQAA